jgi:hypothetical protein
MTTSARVPSLQGSTLFLGDSMTVGLPPFVGVNGQTTFLAEVNRTADWLLSGLRDIEKRGGLDGPQRPVNATVLIGANDVGGSRTPAQIFDDISNVWAILHAHGIRVIAMTLPPFKGWTNYASRYAAIEAKREALNALIASSTLPDLTIRLDQLTADASDPERLSRAYDSGDHLHPQKPALGALIQAAVAGAGLPEPSPPSPLAAKIPPADLATPTGSSLLPYVMLGFAALGGVFVLTRKRH